LRTSAASFKRLLGSKVTERKGFTEKAERGGIEPLRARGRSPRPERTAACTPARSKTNEKQSNHLINPSDGTRLAA
jgi:hypothetical protein